MIPTAIALGLSLSAFLALGWMDYQNALSRVTSDLSQKSMVAARRLSAEVFLGPKGAVDSVSKVLTQDLGLSEVLLKKETPPCELSISEKDAICFVKKGSLVWAVRPVPFVQDPQYVQVALAAPSYWSNLNLKFFAWGTLPVLLLIGFGVFLQLRLLKKHLIGPIEQLADKAATHWDVPEYWPTELATLASDLNQAFAQRDHAMIGQLAGGVIHDIKTLIHAITTSTELVREQPEDSPKRASRLELLYKACSINAEKIKAIIESTLDGSREIKVKSFPCDLSETVYQAIDSNNLMAQRRQVTVEAQCDVESTEVPHDPVQLERVLTNLIRNGIEAFDGGFCNPDAGKTVRVIISRSSDAEVKVSVEDSGPGLAIPPEQLLSSVRTTKTHGTGLGLWVSRKIVEAHQGTLTAGSSSALKGARFEILLPAEGGET